MNAPTPGTRIVYAGISRREWTDLVRQVPRTKLCAPPLDAKARAVLLELSFWMNAKSPTCFRTQFEIAQQTGFAESTVRAALKQCRALKWIEAERIPDSRGRSKETWYRYHATVPVGIKYSSDVAVVINEVPLADGGTFKKHRSKSAEVPPDNRESTATRQRHNINRTSSNSNKTPDPTPREKGSTQPPPLLDDVPPPTDPSDYGTTQAVIRCIECRAPYTHRYEGRPYCLAHYTAATESQFGAAARKAQVPP